MRVQRRDFITLLGTAAAAWPLAARAQQLTPLIGFLRGGGQPDTNYLAAFRAGLSERGYVEGRNLAIELRTTDQNDGLPSLAADFVRRQAAVIVTAGVPATTAAKAATTTIPIVFQMGADPVAFGLVASLNRPGANLTGIVTLGVGLGPKQLELLHELTPATTVMALLVNPANPSGAVVVSELQEAAHKLGLQLHIVYARTERDFEPAFATLQQLGVGGLVISNEGLFIGRSEELAALTLRHKVLAVHVAPQFSAAGGLVSYGWSAAEEGRLLGLYTTRILKGDKPADLPVQQVTKIELAINLKTAKAFGLTVPITLLGRADEVIE